MSEKLYALTGATGHVGYALLKEMLAHGDKTRILIRKDPGYFKGMDVEMVKGDVTDYDSLVKAFAGCDTVFHLAGCVEIKAGFEEKIRQINVDGTKNVVKACFASGVKRLVYMSSVDTYPPLPGNEEMTEIYKYAPTVLEGAYAKTKAEATVFVLDSQGQNGLDVVVVQPAACMGPYDFKVSSVGSMIRMFMDGKFPVTLKFGGYNFVDVRDVALLTRAAAEKGTPGSCYIACNKMCTVDEFIKLLAEACGTKAPKIGLGHGFCNLIAPLAEVYYKAADKTPLFTRYSIRKLCSNCNFSYAKAAEELGYSPRPLLVSLKDTVAWIRENE